MLGATMKGTPAGLEAKPRLGQSATQRTGNESEHPIRGLCPDAAKSRVTYWKFANSQSMACSGESISLRGRGRHCEGVQKSDAEALVRQVNRTDRVPHLAHITL